MKVMGLGLDLDGRLLFPPRDDEEVFEGLVSALEANAERVQGLTRATQEAARLRGERARAVLDPGDPRAAGWTWLANAADPQIGEIARVLEPLARHRGMSDPAAPLLYQGEPPEQWLEWLHQNYYALGLEGAKVPQYVLIVGGPEQVPFLFQSVLDTVANVGRVAFDTPDDLRQYVEKLIRLETAAEPVVREEAVLFAPDAGFPDPTHYSRRQMVEPLAEYVRDELRFSTRVVVGEEATKAGLLSALQAGRPALVYTASHGLGAAGAPAEVQRRFNGAICCQHAGELSLDALFTGDDVPLDQPFLEGAVFFQFACYGYGTPALSDSTHWIKGVPEQHTDADFVAALPRKLLAHPRGPIAFIGHVDIAFLLGFAASEAPPPFLERWHERIAPFKSALQQLLGVQPAGLAMQDMNMRYSTCNAQITHTYDQQQRGRLQWNERLKARFLDTWLMRGDAQNYMLFGDPAARLRIAT
ncbi:MAG TPA: hypothetical protein VF746_16380 [Longimicrobium sp.]|jgi:hypothetical protein